MFDLFLLFLLLLPFISMNGYFDGISSQTHQLHNVISKRTKVGHYWPASETAFHWRADGDQR